MEMAIFDYQNSGLERLDGMVQITDRLMEKKLIGVLTNCTKQVDIKEIKNREWLLKMAPCLCNGIAQPS